MAGGRLHYGTIVAMATTAGTGGACSAQDTSPIAIRTVSLSLVRPPPTRAATRRAERDAARHETHGRDHQPGSRGRLSKCTGSGQRVSAYSQHRGPTGQVRESQADASPQPSYRYWTGGGQQPPGPHSCTHEPLCTRQLRPDLRYELSVSVYLVHRHTAHMCACAARGLYLR